MRAVICGAGIAGLALAWWLERDGWQVVLVERAPGPRDEGYLIDFFGSGYDVAALMGLLPDLRRMQTGIRTVHYVDPAGRGRGRLEYDRFAGAFDGRVFTILRGDLERVLREALGDRVPVRYGTTVDSVSFDATGVDVTLSDGGVQRADLLVGADGVHSRVRGLLFGPEAPYLRYLGYHTASYVFTDDALRARVGKRFLVVAVPDRQAGLYPTDGGRLAVWLVHRAPDPALPADPRATLAAVHADLGAVIRAALAHCPEGPGLYYDQVAQIEMDGWTRGPVTLVGDACQAVSLMAGQGASMALGGAYVLADELRRGGPVAAAAARYERRMRPVIRDKQRVGRRTARWLVPPSRWRLVVRGAALAAARLPGATALLRPAVAAMRASVVPPEAVPPAPSPDHTPRRG
jgi:2-polyprenyl-6-methoxyphenol hydroxylase-like FAD-dependent oxidoreductase